MTKHLTDSQIAIRIVPTHLRWPEAGTSAVWKRLHECVHQLHEFARTIDNDCAKIEENKALGRDQLERQRTEIFQIALKRLMDFKPLKAANLCRGLPLLASSRCHIAGRQILLSSAF